MLRPLVAINERRGFWAGQLRARLADRPARWRETRGTSDLLAALDGEACPIVVLDLGARPAEGLERLVHVSVESPSALVLVLEPEDRPGFRSLARECGASCVRSGFVPPPEISALVDRWIALARHRTAQAGRVSAMEDEPDPDDPLGLLGA